MPFRPDSIPTTPYPCAHTGASGKPTAKQLLVVLIHNGLADVKEASLNKPLKFLRGFGMAFVVVFLLVLIAIFDRPIPRAVPARVAKRDSARKF